MNVAGGEPGREREEGSNDVDARGGGDGDQNVGGNGRGGEEEGGWMLLNEDVIKQLRRGGSDIAQLDVLFRDSPHSTDFDAGSVDWESEGDIIAGNTRLVSLSFNAFYFHSLPQQRANFEHFILALARNRSIKRLFMGETMFNQYFFPGGRGGDPMLFPALAPFFEHNINLRTVEIGSVEEGIGHDMNGITMTALANAMAKSRTIARLVLPRAICQGTQQIDTNAWLALSKCLQGLESSLIELNLNYNYIDGEGAYAIVQSLANMTSLSTLDLEEALFLDMEGWRTFFHQLSGLHSLQSLCLNSLNLGDDDVAPMVDALANARSLRRLSLHKNPSISAHGWRTFASVLRKSSCQLENLDLVCYGEPFYFTEAEERNKIETSVVIAIAEALAHNKRLTVLQLGRNHPNITVGWMALANTLCDQSSIDSIYASNHTLARVSSSDDSGYITTGEDIFSWIPSWEEFDWEKLSDEQKCLVSCLRLNEGDNKFEVARRKIILYHFSNGEENIQEFEGLELPLIPRAVAWMGRDDADLSLLYRFVQSAPSLFELNGRASAVGGKRKRRS